MSRLTQEQIERLQRSPHVAQVSEYCVTFKPEFKRFLAEQKHQGRRLREVLREWGIDPDDLGQKRIENLSYQLNRLGREKDELANERKSPKVDLDLEARVRWLTHELEYAKQEIEFLKKLQMANTEARKQWESKHQPE